MKSPRSGIVPALTTASFCAPLRARIVPARRSQVMRGRSSPNSARGVAAVEHVEHVLEQLAAQLGVRVRARDERVELIDRRRSPRSPRSRRSAARARRARCAARRSARSRPSRMRRATTAHSSRSARNFGKIRPLLVPPTPWPERPIRCSPRATDFGDSTWITRSTAPMSMPSSSDEVATRQGSSPAFRSSSIVVRSSRASEPWWARAISNGAASPGWRLPSAASSLSRSASRSAARRLLTKTIVERCVRTSSSSSG